MNKLSVPDRFELELDMLEKQHLMRLLDTNPQGVDFYSNDYLGIARNQSLVNKESTGASGSRLISGNYKEINELETFLAQHHFAESALVFPSGYQANVGLFQAISKREDLIIYDEQVHASLRDGIRLSFASSSSFKHNNLQDLQQKLIKANSDNTFVIVESLYSMSGAKAPLSEIISLCKEYGAFLIVDEAHANGIYGEHGEGLIDNENSAKACMARIYGFGKALACQGACIVGSNLLKQYLVNKHRAFIYSTGISPVLTGVIKQNYKAIREATEQRSKLINNISYFNKLFGSSSDSPIKSFPIPGNEAVMKAAEFLQNEGISVKGIRYPSVAKGAEQLRIVIHSFNTAQELEKLHSLLKEQIKL